ncbi:DNA repair protein RecN [Carboxylicivirga caseinilyticus]|uniref:DNA repair protein RecN n=1 Tax=Carboxylicivirga caseinilyticus TaxID=3417572 RepID=UPI003D32F2DE|nr:DNA repair protein RecN [Marinilabiliaceae bacterium A049]
MLKSLSISNYALIDKVNISLENGLTVITGETGAGKSVLLGALSLILGSRSDLTALLNREKKCVVEGEFFIGNNGLKEVFEANDVDFEESTIIRREVLPTGKSRAFVNDTPVNLQFLKDIGSKLIDVHSQHQNLLLDDVGFQRMVVDSVANNKLLQQDYLIKYKEYKQLNRQIELLIEENNKQKDDLDYLQFQFSQLDEAKLVDGELEELEKQLQELSHVEEIKMNLAEVVGVLNEEPKTVVDSLRDSLNKIHKIEEYLHDGEAVAQRIESAYLDLKDLAEDLDARVEDLEYDPLQIQKVQDRLDLIYSLQKKHHLETISELIDLKDDLQSQLDKINFFDDELDKLKKQLMEVEKKLKEKAIKLTESRKKVLSIVKTSVEKQLHSLGMPHANFVVQMTSSEEYMPYGVDQIEFLFSGNKNGTPSAISKVASGGEMSRVMLSIKSLLSSAKALPTIIFDEIDTGVSGEVADQMGVIMSEMAKAMQVVSITHLPQITVKGHHHYKVFKTDNEHTTVSQIKKLSHEERIVEVAKMLSGSTLTDEAMKNARSLLKN